MVHRIFGRKKYGKTEFVFSSIKNNIENRKRSFLIVPEQYSLSMERRLVRDFGNKANMYVEVLGFTRLCNRVFRESGGLSQTFLDEAGKLLCMTKALSMLSNKLCQYEKSSDTAEFASSSVRACQELSMYGVSPSMLEKASVELCDRNSVLSGKMRDLSLICATYRSVLKNAYSTDGEDLDRLADALSEYNFFGGTDVFFDAFYGFTPQELRIVKSVISQADNAYFTFLTEKNSVDPIFKRSTDSAREIKVIADRVGVQIVDTELESSNLNTEISHIERNFSTERCLISRKCEKVDYQSGSVRIIECSDDISEAKAACAIISKLIRDKKARYRDIAVCARDISSFLGIIDVFFEKSGIPFSVSTDDELLTKPIISYITTAFEFISSWDMKHYLRFIKTGITTATADECAIIENYIRTWSVSGKGEFLSEWYMNPEGFSEQFSESDEKKLNTINSIKERTVGTLLKFSEDISASANAKDIATAVYRLMCDSVIDDNPSEESAKLWNIAVKSLEEMTRVYGDEKLSAKKFCELFTMTVSQYSVTKLPEIIDSVHLGSADLMRGFDVKYMIVLGCNNEYFPAKAFEDSIFTDAERRLMRQNGIELSQNNDDSIYDEFFLAYNIFCEPSDGLCLLYSCKDASGKTLRISPLCLAVSGMLGGVDFEKYPFADIKDNITSVTMLKEQMYDYSDSEFISASRDFLCRDDSIREAFMRADSDILSKGKLCELTTEKLFGSVINSSPSRFDTYSKCRFNYFNRFLLGVRPEVRAELDGAQTGLVSHKVLELFVKELATAKVEGSLPDKQSSKKRILELLDAHFEAITHSRGKANGITKRFEYLYNRLGVILCAMAENLVDEMNSSDFLPVDYELNIGFGEESVKTCPIDIADSYGNVVGTLNIVGQVDRADTFTKDGKTYLRIVDYKTGYKVFNANDVAYGFNLQMLLYLYCLVNGGGEKYGESILPAGVLYIPVSRPSAKAILGESTDESSQSSLKSAFKANGILLSEIDILSAMEHDIGGRFIPAKITKSGELSKTSSIASLEELGGLLKKAANVSSKLALMMKQGEIGANPYSCEVSSCSYCDYKAICRLDRKNPNIRYSLQEVE